MQSQNRNKMGWCPSHEFSHALWTWFLSDKNISSTPLSSDLIPSRKKNLLCYKKCLSIRQKLVLRLNMGWHFYLHYHGFSSWRTYRQGNKPNEILCCWLMEFTNYNILSFCIHKRNLLGNTKNLSTNLSEHPICLPWHELFKCTFFAAVFILHKQDRL